MNAEDIIIFARGGGVSTLKQIVNKVETTKIETILSQCCPKATTVMTDGPSGWCRLGPMLK